MKRHMVIDSENCIVFKASEFGRPRKPSPSFEELIELRKTMTIKQVAKQWSVSTRTVNRWLNRAGASL